MNTLPGFAACILLAAFAVQAPAKNPEFTPVQELHPSYLGMTIEAPGSDGWMVAEQRYKDGWRIMYHHGGDDVASSFVFLKSDRFRTGKFAKQHGSLEQLSREVFKGNRSPDDAQFHETHADVVRNDVNGIEAYHIRIGLEERNNPHYPGAVFTMENPQMLMLHPHDPDQVISVTVSVRFRQDRESVDAEALLASFMEAMRFEGCSPAKRSSECSSNQVENRISTASRTSGSKPAARFLS